MKIFFDTEFIDDGKTIDLISIGLVREDGKEYYAENADCERHRACDWVKTNVFPHLKSSLINYDWRICKSRKQIAKEIVEFVKPEGNTFTYSDYKPEFWAYFADYDWVVLCQLYGRMMDLPEGWPMFCMDVKQLAVAKDVKKIPIINDNVHNALADAKWCRDAYNYLMTVPYRSEL